MDVKKYEAFLDKRYIKELGRVKKVVGLTMESFGPDVVLDDVYRAFGNVACDDFCDCRSCTVRLWIIASL